MTTPPEGTALSMQWWDIPPHADFQYAKAKEAIAIPDIEGISQDELEAYTRQVFGRMWSPNAKRTGVPLPKALEEYEPIVERLLEEWAATTEHVPLTSAMMTKRFWSVVEGNEFDGEGDMPKQLHAIRVIQGMGTMFEGTAKETIEDVEAIADDEELYNILAMAGRLFQGFSTGERSSEKTNVFSKMTLGNNLRRVLKREMASSMLSDAHRALFYRKFAKKQLRMRDATEAEEENGPVVLAMDTSYSVSEPQLQMGAAISVALTAAAAYEGREFHILLFHSSVYKEFVPADLTFSGLVARVRDLFKNDVIQGGTAISEVLKRTTKIVERSPSMGKADLIIISDGCDATPLEQYRQCPFRTFFLDLIDKLTAQGFTGKARPILEGCHYHASVHDWFDDPVAQARRMGSKLL